jgi:hypothetical protein
MQCVSGPSVRHDDMSESDNDHDNDKSTDHQQQKYSGIDYSSSVGGTDTDIESANGHNHWSESLRASSATVTDVDDVYAEDSSIATRNSANMLLGGARTNMAMNEFDESDYDSDDNGFEYVTGQRDTCNVCCFNCGEVELNIFSWPAAFQLSDSNAFKPFSSRQGRLSLAGVRFAFGLWGLAIIAWGSASGLWPTTYWTTRMSGWAFFATTMYFFLAAFYTLIDEPPVTHSFFRKLTMFLYVMGWCWSPTVTGLYWAFLTDSYHTQGLPFAYYMISLHVHGISCGWLFMDMLFNKMEFRHTQLVMVIIVGFVFTIINGSVEILFDLENWKVNSWLTGTVWCAAFIFFIFSFYLGYFLTRGSIAARRVPSFFEEVIDEEEIDELNKEIEREVSEVMSRSQTMRIKTVVDYSRSNSMVGDRAASSSIDHGHMGAGRISIDSHTYEHSRTGSFSDYDSSRKSSAAATENARRVSDFKVNSSGAARARTGSQPALRYGIQQPNHADPGPQEADILNLHGDPSPRGDRLLSEEQQSKYEAQRKADKSRDADRVQAAAQRALDLQREQAAAAARYEEQRIQRAEQARVMKERMLNASLHSDSD